MKNILTEWLGSAAEIAHCIRAVTLCRRASECNTGDGQLVLVGYKASLRVTAGGHSITHARVSDRTCSDEVTCTPCLIRVISPRPLVAIGRVVSGEVGESGAEVIDERQLLANLLQLLGKT